MANSIIAKFMTLPSQLAIVTMDTSRYAKKGEITILDNPSIRRRLSLPKGQDIFSLRSSQHMVVSAMWEGRCDVWDIQRTVRVDDQLRITVSHDESALDLVSMRAASLALDDVVQAITRPTRGECQTALKEVTGIGPFSAEHIVSLFAVIDKHTKVLPWSKKRLGRKYAAVAQAPQPQ
jgi:hypothetical protein